MADRVTVLVVDEPHLPVFDKADATDCCEATFEATAVRVLGRLYSDCHVFSFKELLFDWRCGWRPDIAIVDRSFAYWFIVEVEIITHSLEKHVLPQVRGLRDGEFSLGASSELARRVGVNADQAATLLRYVPRYTAVVANGEDAKWATALESEDIQFLSISSYTRDRGPPAFVVGGVLRATQRCVGYGTVYATDRSIRTAAGSFWVRDSYVVVDEYGKSEWSCHVSGGGVWLSKTRGTLPFRNCSPVQILSLTDDVLHIREM
jgi:hypothetical protein